MALVIDFPFIRIESLTTQYVRTACQACADSQLDQSSQVYTISASGDQTYAES